MITKNTPAEIAALSRQLLQTAQQSERMLRELSKESDAQLKAAAARLVAHKNQPFMHELYFEVRQGLISAAIAAADIDELVQQISHIGSKSSYLANIQIERVIKSGHIQCACERAEATDSE